METDTIKISDLEPGMTYLVKQRKDRSYIFKYDRKRDEDDIVAKDVIGVETGFFAFGCETDVTVTSFMRKATIEEDVWLDECVRAKKYLTKDVALAEFDRRFSEPDFEGL